MEPVSNSYSIALSQSKFTTVTRCDGDAHSRVRLPTNTQKERKPKRSKLDLSSSRSLKDLREACRAAGLRVSGTKSQLKDRIDNYTRITSSASQIQRWWSHTRNRRLHALQGFTGQFASVCTNCADFNTLDDLDDIPSDSRFIFRDSRGFQYGCDIASFEELLKKSGVLSTDQEEAPAPRSGPGPGPEHETTDWRPPWLRRRMPRDVHIDFHREGLLNPYDREPIQKEAVSRAICIIAMRNRWTRVTNDASSGTSSGAKGARAKKRASPPCIFGVLVSEFERLFVNARSAQTFSEMTPEKKVEQVAVELFQLVDQMGHYTNYEWFWDLSAVRLKRFYRELVDIWLYRANLDSQVKAKIIPPNGRFSEDMRTIERQYSKYNHDMTTYNRLGYTLDKKLVYTCKIGDTDRAVFLKRPIYYYNIERVEDIKEINVELDTTVELLGVILEPHERIEAISAVRGEIERYWLHMGDLERKLKRHFYELRILVLRVIYRFVASGESHDDRTLGTYYVLGALTVASKNAAEAMPWLYQSFASASLVDTSNVLSI